MTDRCLWLIVYYHSTTWLCENFIASGNSSCGTVKFQVKRFRNEANNNGSNEGIHRDTVSTLSKTRFPRLIAGDKAELFHILFHFASFSPFLNSTFPPPSQTLLYKLSLFLFVAFLPSLLFFSFFIVGNAESIASGEKKNLLWITIRAITVKTYERNTFLVTRMRNFVRISVKKRVKIYQRWKIQRGDEEDLWKRLIKLIDLLSMRKNYVSTRFNICMAVIHGIEDEKEHWKF